MGPEGDVFHVPILNPKCQSLLPESHAALAPWQLRKRVVVMSRTSMYFHSLFEFGYFWMRHCEEAPATHSTSEWILPQQQDLTSNQIQSLSIFGATPCKIHQLPLKYPVNSYSIISYSYIYNL